MADQFKQGADGGNTIISAGVALDEYLGGPLKKLFTSTKSRPRVELGEWHDFLYNAKDKVWSAPVLLEKYFLPHMERCAETGFVPQGTCTATAPWAQLVHGLGITPNDNIITRRILSDGSCDEIELEIEGKVICHVINLLSLEGGWNHISKKGGKSHTSLGDFIWETDPNDQTILPRLWYRPATEREICSPHPFFPLTGTFRRTPEDLLVRYRRFSPETGTSEPLLAWPGPKESIVERLKKREQLLQALRNPNVDQLPILISETWQQNAERVRRRAFGGENFKFLDVLVEDAHQHIRNMDDLSFKLEVLGSSWGKSALLADCANFASELKKSSMVLEQSRRCEERSDESGPGREAFRPVLKSYENEPPNSWKHDLYLCREEIMGIMNEDLVLGLNPKRVYLLPLDPASALWQPSTLQIEEVTTTRA